jgi:hypothetical protein
MIAIKYWLFIVLAGNMQVVGPFDGLIACEKAASQVTIVARERARNLNVGTVCLSHKHHEFKYKEPR